jgi:hypothetical protein
MQNHATKYQFVFCSVIGPLPKGIPAGKEIRGFPKNFLRNAQKDLDKFVKTHGVDKRDCDIFAVKG